MDWILLLLAGLVEIGMAFALKAAAGWTRPVPALLGLGAAIVSIALLTAALRSLPIGTAYAIWTGIGAIGVTVVGIVVFQESASLLRLACIGMIFAGIIGLKLQG
ncbi:MAG: QacE family quaternary ammonium compound efflux SMR transporter [Burkholderiaceae bacterium]|jgi:quaternary ammonium compound-resistance protein SugE|nr:QacE family quaternary ammonium compound efflux SMR transporter [Burkholderiaceae bacterium]